MATNIKVTFEYIRNGKWVTDSLEREVSMPAESAVRLRDSIDETLDSFERSYRRDLVSHTLVGEPPMTATGSQASGSSGWSADTFKDFWAALSPTVREALKEMATKQPKGYPVAELAEKLGLPGTESLGGRLGATNRTLAKFPGKTMPFWRDPKAGNAYVMPADIVGFVEQLPVD